MTALSVTPVRSAVGLRRSWTLACLVGELVGFVPPAITGATLGTLGVPDAVLVVALSVAGLLEGAAIGITQARVLAHHAPTVDRRGWVIATMAAAGFAWFVGMGGGALMGAADTRPALLLALLVPAWVAALLSMGYAQWRVLRNAIAALGPLDLGHVRRLADRCDDPRRRVVPDARQLARMGSRMHRRVRRGGHGSDGWCTDRAHTRTAPRSLTNGRRMGQTGGDTVPTRIGLSRGH